ncbi:hypothetical protein M422DRAFT_93782, partial [Sphaerobolus stellatus SS14]
KYNLFHICKPLIQAVPPPSEIFFTQVIQHRTQPLYKHPAIHPKDSPPFTIFNDPDEGSITDGDDHVWLGNSRI